MNATDKSSLDVRIPFAAFYTLMAALKSKRSANAGRVTIQLHLVGVIVFSLALVLASVLVTYGLLKHGSASAKSSTAHSAAPEMASENSEEELTDVPPWGQLVTRDIDLQQPEEYVAYETGTQRVETWLFTGTTPAQVKAILQSCGLTPTQVDRALSAALATYTNASTVILPDEDLVFSLTPAMRSKLYSAIVQSSGSNGNELFQFPFCFPGSSFEARIDKTKINPATLAMIRKLLYPRGNAQCFSDLRTVLKKIADDRERLELVKMLSHQSAVLLRIRVWPDTDVDKLIGYWNWPNAAREINIRPLLESMTRLPEGGSVSILYFLPPFARQRLYTFPLPAQAGDPSMDCHWSTMNFFNATPDNRLSEPKYTVDFLKSHYYLIGKATAYGDRIFLLDQNGNAIHSAVYLADDIVFTKNGNNYTQPWMLMHLKDLIAEYTTDTAPNVAIYRDRSW